MQWVWHKSWVLQVWPGLVLLAERKAQQPALAFVYAESDGQHLRLVASDIDVQWQVQIPDLDLEPGAVLIPARKWWDIIRSVPDDLAVVLRWEQPGGPIEVTAGNSQFTLSSLDPAGYPHWPETPAPGICCEIGAPDLKHLIESVAFAASEQDSRVYLNGILWQLHPDRLVLAASDGHRLAESVWVFPAGSTTVHAAAPPAGHRILVPRRSALDIGRILSMHADRDRTVTLASCPPFLQIQTPDGRLTVRLIDSPYPEYTRFFPSQPGPIAQCERNTLRHALQRMAIVSGHHEIGLFQIQPGQLELKTDPLGQETAREHIPIDYTGPEQVIHLNIRYCLDFLQVCDPPSGAIRWSCTAPDAPVLWEGDPRIQSRYVLMPFRR